MFRVWLRTEVPAEIENLCFYVLCVGNAPDEN